VLAKLRDSKHISWHWKGLCRDPDDEADVAIRSFRAPGTGFFFFFTQII